MIRFSSFMDLTGKGRKLTGGYHGKHNQVLEARIFSEEKNNKLEVGVSLWEDDVERHRFNRKTNSLDIFYNPSYQDEARAGFSYTRFKVPDSIKSINIYDMDQNP